MIDASHVKVHPDAAGARGGNQAMGRTKGGATPRYIWPWMRMVCRCDSGTTADCTAAAQLIAGFRAEYLLADRGYDTDAFILKAVDEGMTTVIPPRDLKLFL